MTIAQAAPSPRPQEGHDTLVVTITPSKAQAYGQCPLYFAEVFSKQALHLANQNIQRGKYLHSLIERYNVAIIDGTPMSIDEVVARVPLPAAFRDGGDDERVAIDFARASLFGHKAWLEEQDFAALCAAEQYIRTTPRPVAGIEGVAVVFSGRIDLVALTRAHTLALIDFKAGNVLTSEALQTAPASFVQAHLGAYTYASDATEIIQVVPATGQASRARLTDQDIEAGTLLCRAMVASVKEQSWSPRPGAYCSYCDYAAQCPAFIGGAGLTTVAF